MWRTSVGEYDIDLNTYKCQHCGLYYPGYDIYSHEKSCHRNPENRSDNGD